MTMTEGAMPVSPLGNEPQWKIDRAEQTRARLDQLTLARTIEMTPRHQLRMFVPKTDHRYFVVQLFRFYEGGWAPQGSSFRIPFTNVDEVADALLTCRDERLRQIAVDTTPRSRCHTFGREG